MTKNEFDKKLTIEFEKRSVKEKNKILSYYDELFYDRLENGESEEEIIESFGSIEEIVLNVKKGEYSENVQSTTPTKPKTIKSRTAILIILACTFYIWLPVVLGAIVVIIGIFAALAAVFVSCWAISAGFIATGAISVVGIVFYFGINFAGGLYQFGVGLLLLSIGLIMVPLLIKMSKTIYNYGVNLYNVIVRKIKERK